MNDFTPERPSMNDTVNKPNTASAIFAPPWLIPVTAPQARPYLEHITHIYTDLDGTLFAPGGILLANHAGEPSTATAEALVALKRAGIEVIIVTGRDGNQGRELLRILNLETFIGELGCLVIEGAGAGARVSYELGEWENVTLAADLAPGILPEGLTPYHLIQKSGVIERLLAAFPGKLEPHFLYPNQSPNQRQVTYALRGFVDTERTAALLEREHLPLLLLDNGEIHPQTHTLVDCPEIHIYHLMPSGVSKASAVAKDIARRDIAPGQTLAIGDAAADVAMGEHTGSLVVMANALHSTAVQAALDKRNARGNVTLYTENPTADGWTEFAQSLLATRR
ncbi:MAG: Cof-type HAD-IIB family hydrolase [Coriobacteriales bacterium]|jgi:hydroxymethylpyrimidine pyrophosphatase-like HAD family hydrolase|nr:Cof-type HAD-IIB family hydrolase [Coriobacteriales bacterium]